MIRFVASMFSFLSSSSLSEKKSGPDSRYSKKFDHRNRKSLVAVVVKGVCVWRDGGGTGAGEFCISFFLHVYYKRSDLKLH